MKAELCISDIQRFSLHDGPGIRTTVFFQGCPLCCPWCSNPEAISSEPPPMFSGKYMTALEVLDVVLRDKAFYDTSGGGITLSGGEPFMQFSGAMKLLAESKKAKLHTAVETCGQVDTKLFKESLELVDLYLFDIKHSDRDTLHKITGGNQSVIIENLKSAAEYSAEKVIIRVPVVFGFNDTNETLDAIFKVATDHKIQEVSLLPYHTLGKGKYTKLGKEYPYDSNYPMMTKDDLEPFITRGRALGLNMI